MVFEGKVGGYWHPELKRGVNSARRDGGAGVVVSENGEESGLGTCADSSWTQGMDAWGLSLDSVVPLPPRTNMKKSQSLSGAHGVLRPRHHFSGP